MLEVKYYMNNPCYIIRDIGGEFSEVKMIPQWVEGFEGSQWCFGCQVGSNDGSHPKHSCDDTQEIIDTINDSQSAIIVMVENRLLQDKPIEFKKIKQLNDDILNKESHLKDVNDKISLSETKIKQLEKFYKLLENKKGELLIEIESLNKEINGLNIEIDKLKKVILNMIQVILL